MEDRVFMVKTLGEVLTSLESIPEPEGGFYALYVAENTTQLTKDMTCTVIFESDEDEETYVSEFAKANHLATVVDLRLALHVMDVAKCDKSDLNVQDLVDALNYYLDNDAFIQFDE